MTIPLFGGDGWEAPQLLEIGGDAVNGIYYTTHFSPENSSPEVQTFIAKFKKRWNGETPDAMAALGYDSAELLANAIKRAGSTKAAAIRDAIAQTKNLPGVPGIITIDAERNPTKAAVVVTVKDGKFKFVETIAP